MKYLKNIKTFNESNDPNKEKLDVETFKEICTDLTDEFPGVEIGNSKQGERTYFGLNMKYKILKTKNLEYFSNNYNYSYYDNKELLAHWSKTDGKKYGDVLLHEEGNINNEEILTNIDEHIKTQEKYIENIKNIRKIIEISDNIIQRIKNFNFTTLNYQVFKGDDELYVRIKIEHIPMFHPKVL